MSGLSDYLEDAWLGTLTGVAFTPLTEIHVGLHTSDGGETGAGWTATEVTGSGYARAVIDTTLELSPTSVGNASALMNNVGVTFPSASGPWGTITHFTLWDDSGNLLFHGELSTPRLVGAAEAPHFPPETIAFGVN